MYSFDDIIGETKPSFDWEFSSIGEVISIEELERWFHKRRFGTPSIQLAYSDLLSQADDLLSYWAFDMPSRYILQEFQRIYLKNDSTVNLEKIEQWLAGISPFVDLQIVCDGVFMETQFLDDRVLLSTITKVGVDIKHFRHINALEELCSFLGCDLGIGNDAKEGDYYYYKDASYDDPLKMKDKI